MGVLAEVAGFTEGLCLALAHEWQPDRLLMLAYTCYLDESGDDNHTLMGGVLARADHWKKFDKHFADIQRRHGFKVFHTKEFKNRTGEFRGWSPQQCLALISDLANLSNTLRDDAVVAILNHDLYERVYRKPGEKGAFLSRYGICFHACLIHFIKVAVAHKYRKKFPSIDLVLERGHKNVGAANAIVSDFKKNLLPTDMLLRHVVLADKDYCGQLMMADFLSHMELLRERKVQAGTHARKSDIIPKGMAGITTLKVSEDYLTDMRERALNKRVRYAVSSLGQSS